MKAFVMPIVLLFLAICPASITPDPVPAQVALPVPDPLPSRSEEPEPRELVVEATAYSYTGSRTASGTWPKRGTIAVDPKVISLGTRLWVEGYGYGVAEDTGGLIKGQVIDVFMESESEAIQWGRRMVKVRIME